MPGFHSRVSKGHNGRNLGLERDYLVLYSVANITLRHLAGVVENPRRLRNRSAKPNWGGKATAETAGTAGTPYLLILRLA